MAHSAVGTKSTGCDIVIESQGFMGYLQSSVCTRLHLLMCNLRECEFGEEYDLVDEP